MPDHVKKPENLADIPSLHTNVDFHHLKENGKLLSDENINLIRKELAGAPDGRYGKKTLLSYGIGPVDEYSNVVKFEYGIVKKGNKYFAVYEGAEKGRALGAGGFGMVKLAQDLDTGEWDTIKIMKKEEDRSRASLHRAGNREARNLSKVDQYKAGYLRERKDQVEIVMTLADGVPADALIEKKMSTLNRLDICIGMLERIQDLHENHQILHRDIKPNNIMHDFVNRKTTLIDFGLAEIGEKNKNDELEVLAPWCGTPGFIAPEIKEGSNKNIYNEKTEVYALGMSLAEELGFSIHSRNEYGEDVFYGDEGYERFLDNIKDPITAEKMLGLIKKMVDPNPDTRITLSAASNEIQKIRTKYYEEGHLHILSKINNLAYVDINDYKNSSDAMKRNILLALMAVDVVHLIDTGGKSKPEDQMQIKHELERWGIQVFNQILLKKENEPIQESIDKCTRYLEDKNKVIYHSYHIKTTVETLAESKENTYHVKNIAAIKSTKRAYEQQMEKSIEPVVVVKHHLDFILKSLRNQLKNLEDRENKHKHKKNYQHDARIGLLKSAISEINTNHPPMNYGNLNDKLNSLEADLVKNRPESRAKFLDETVGMFGLFSAKTTDVVRNTRKEIEMEAKHGITKKR